MAGVYDSCAVCCAKLIHPPGRGKASKYCGTECAETAAAKRREGRQFAVCCALGCGKPATRISAQMCEMHYCRQRRNGRLDSLVDTTRYTSCQHCGVETKGIKHCGSRCAARDSRGVAASIRCGACDKDFQSVSGRLRCSNECEAAYRRKRANAFYAANTGNPEFMARMRAHEYKRKARKRGAFVEHVDRDLVMQRDKWVCHLCKEKIPKGAKWPNGLFGSLDHVVPLAAGGLHSYDNIKAAHLSCNCSKGAKTIGQLGLMLSC